MAGRAVEATASGGPAGYDAGKKIKGLQRQLRADAAGFSFGIVVLETSIQDRDGVLPVHRGMVKKIPRVSKLWADGAYRVVELALMNAQQGLEPIHEHVTNSKDMKGFTVLFRRWVVECPFVWLGRCRRLAKDDERSLERSLAWAASAGQSLHDASGGTGDLSTKY